MPQPEVEPTRPFTVIEPTGGTAETTPNDLLAELADLDESADLEEVQRKTVELVSSLKGADALTVQTVRERFIRSLHRRLSAPASYFDTAVGSEKRGSGDWQAGETQRGLCLENPEPWPTPVSGVDLLDDLRATFLRFLVLPEEAATALALWSLHTYVFDAFWITPRLAITSPEKRCGKTLVLTLLTRLVSKPLQGSNVSPAVVFRAVEAYQPTLLIDEADTFLAAREELRGILNSGHQQGGGVLRCVGESFELGKFSTFAPVAITMIGSLPDTLDDRSVAIRMRRKRPQEAVERLRLDRLEPLEVLRQRAVRWADDHRESLVAVDPETPPQLHDRATDNWRALLAIADEAGGVWPKQARHAALALSGTQGDDLSAGGAATR